MSLQDELTELVAQPIELVPERYISAQREMNIHDFHYPDQGGVHLLSVMDSAQQELAVFMRERGLELAEPFQVRISIDVTARAVPMAEDDPRRAAIPVPK